MFRGSPPREAAIGRRGVCGRVAIRIHAEIGGVTVDRPVRVAARANAMAIRGRQGPEAVAIAPPWMASACAVAIMAPKRGQGHYLHHQLAHWNTSNLNADEQGGKGQRGDS
jgi:hypothetical protein